jgi:hypothetical protein
MNPTACLLGSPFV